RGDRAYRRRADPHRALSLQLGTLDRARRLGGEADVGKAAGSVAAEGGRPRRLGAGGAKRFGRQPGAQPARGNHPAERAVSMLLHNRWLLGGLGLAAFALVAWLTGDLVTLGGWRPFESEGGRAALIA